MFLAKALDQTAPETCTKQIWSTYEMLVSIPRFDIYSRLKSYTIQVQATVQICKLCIIQMSEINPVTV